MQTWENINTTDWAMSIFEPGQIVTEADRINQGLYILFNTQQGTCPLDSLFGLDILGNIDKPVNQIGPALSANMIEQVGIYFTTIKLVKITYAVNALGQIVFTTGWSGISENITGEIITTYGNIT